MYTMAHEHIQPSQTLNYRHSFHAGSSADVFKHIVLTLILEALQAKPAPFCVIDTHAGSGLYPLEGFAEYQQGIGLLWPQRQNWSAFARYFACIERHNGEKKLSRYPGSPLIISEFLRPQDRAVFIELHPQDYELLKLHVAGTQNTAVHLNDAWQALKAFIPPKENRGLVLIDPPYEQKDEFEKIVAVLEHSLRHWRNGMYAVWYPVKERRAIEKFHKAIRSMGAQAYAVELTTLPTDVEQRLNGSGLMLINPPWTLQATLKQVLPGLAAFFAGAAGKAGVRFIDLDVTSKAVS